MSSNRVSRGRAVFDGESRRGTVTSELAGRIGRAVCEFLDAREAGRLVIPETYLVEFDSDEYEIARRYFSVAEDALGPVLPDPAVGD
jgi:hypothetical protein